MAHAIRLVVWAMHVNTLLLLFLLLLIKLASAMTDLPVQHTTIELLKLSVRVQEGV